MRSVLFAVLTGALLLCHGVLPAQVTADMDAKTFVAPGLGTYVLINMAILGGSLKAPPNAHGYHQARVEATMIAEKDGQVAAFGKAEVIGPEFLDSVPRDFIHQERLALAPGSYDLEILLLDMSATDTTRTRFFGPLVVADLLAGPAYSDILLVEPPSADALGKAKGSGLTIAGLVPSLSTYYPKEVTDLAFYAELYGMDQAVGRDSLFMLSYQIESFETRAVQGAFRRVSRPKAADVVPVLSQFDIRDLPSGNFVLVVEARDRTGKLLARQQQFFQRSNPVTFDMADLNAANVAGTFAERYTNADTLVDHIRSMRPIATDLERKIIDDRGKDKDLELMQRFFYSFWQNRDALDPEGAWKRYRTEVIKVNQIYGCRIKRGYETDRGRVHLKYGMPNTIMDQPNDHDGYPYQIWHFYRVGRYTNKRFVFYLPDKAGCYELLHSEVPGEMRNDNWNQLLHARNIAMPNVQDFSVPMDHGQRVQDFFDNPR
ncbi:MAG: GWxTD domain-containing protein [Flavobacteriales bacterium]|nr:GWxTD domain-containing protein [Flavobacteriales bacterium]